MMKTLKNWIIVALLFVTTIVFAQTEYYIAEGGTGSGTFESPFGTLDDALAVAKAYDTITLRAGTYDPPSTYIDKHHLTIQGYQGERPHIKANYLDGSFTSGVTIANVIWVYYTAEYFTLKNLEVSGGTCYVIKLDNYFDKGIAAKGATFENCEFHHSGTDVVKITPLVDDVTFKNCEIHNSGLAWKAGAPESSQCKDPDENPNAQGIDNVNGDNMLVTQCHIHDILPNNPGIFFKGGSRNCIIERTLFENAYGGIWLGGHADPDWYTSDNPDYYHNFNAIVRNNIIKNMMGAGIVFLAAKTPKVYNNTLIDCGNGAGDQIALGFRHQATALNNGQYVNGPTTNAFIANNVIVRNASSKNQYKDFVIEISGYSDDNLHAIKEGTLQMQNNRYYDDNHTDLRVRTDNNGDGWREGDDTTTLAQWQALSLHNSAYADVNSIFADPKIDADGKPITGSNCIGTGIDIDGLNEDFYGNPRPSGSVDIGAVQFSSTPNPTYKLTVTATNGKVVKSPDQTTYKKDTTVKLTASPETGYKFVNWTGDKSSTESEITIKMDSNKTLTANFSKIDEPKTDKVISISGLPSVKQGQEVTISVGYEVSEARTIRTSLHLNVEPWTWYAGASQDVSAGSGTIELTYTIPSDLAVGVDKYQYYGYITEVGGKWKEGVPNKSQRLITVTGKEDNTAAYKYLRLKILSNLGGTQVEYYDIDWFENETDFNSDYFWGNANNLPFNIDLDLGKNTKPTSIRFENGYDKTFQAKDFECYGSNDNKNWTLLHSETDLTVNDWGAESTYTTFYFNTSNKLDIAKQKQVLVYPNPSSGPVSLNYTATYKGDVSIKVFNLIGKQVKELKLQKNEADFVHQIDLSNQDAGIYFIQFTAGDYRSNHRVFKK